MGCNTNRVVRFQTAIDSTSIIKLKPSRPIENVVVLIDGNLVWEKTRTVKSLTIENVPKGDHSIQFVSGSWYLKEKIDFTKPVRVEGKGETKVELISIPPVSTGYWIYVSALMLVPWISYYAYWY
jgi:hypothetical protein